MDLYSNAVAFSDVLGSIPRLLPTNLPGTELRARYAKSSTDEGDAAVPGGTTQQTLEGGAAVFDDLTVGNVTGCVPTCDILLRFSLVGALCQVSQLARNQRRLWYKV